jgi:hypothetical protein
VKRTAALVVLFMVVLCVTVGGQESVAEDPALYAVGALGASNLYTTYFLLGTLADGYATAAYTAQFAEELAHDIIGLNEGSIEVLQRLRQEGNLSGSDATLVDDMIAAHELLIQQTWGLLSYVEDSSQTADWFLYRRQSWDLIQELLDIE